MHFGLPVVPDEYRIYGGDRKRAARRRRRCLMPADERKPIHQRWQSGRIGHCACYPHDERPGLKLCGHLPELVEAPELLAGVAVLLADEKHSRSIWVDRSAMPAHRIPAHALKIAPMLAAASITSTVSGGSAARRQPGHPDDTGTARTSGNARHAIAEFTAGNSLSRAGFVPGK